MPWCCRPKRRTELKSVDQAHCFVLRKLIDALRSIAPVAARCGTSDLALEDATRCGGKEILGQQLAG